MDVPFPGSLAVATALQFDSEHLAVALISLFAEPPEILASAWMLDPSGSHSLVPPVVLVTLFPTPEIVIVWWGWGHPVPIGTVFGTIWCANPFCLIMRLLSDFSHYTTICAIFIRNSV